MVRFSCIYNALSAILLLCDAYGTLAGQIPIVDGIIGGVPKTKPAPNTMQRLAPNVTTTPGHLRVTENSGICETTPGVYQASGYGDLTSTESIWFWFFAAREDPENAPFVIWLNGGPGSSSMLGLFQEHGPCRITNDSTDVTINPYSWNNVANMLYIDQPVGTGFSYGDTTVSTSEEAAADLWTFMQIFFADSRFSKFAKNDFAIWTESYGGHYGPVTAAYFLQQNAVIGNGNISGVHINLKVLGIGDGLTDPISQYPSYLPYSADNNYHPLVTPDVIDMANSTMYRPFGCLDRMTDCATSGGDPDTCSLAQLICNELIIEPLAGDYDVYDVRAVNPDPYPPSIDSYLSNTTLMAQIGAESQWEQSNEVVYGNFADSGDWMISTQPQLEQVIDSGIRTIIYAGDADFIVCYLGLEAMANTLETQFTTMWHAQSLANWTVAGELAGVYKNAGSLSYVRFFGAGHEVPAYKYGSLGTGQAALTMFTQIMANESLLST
ncbi:serine carboxypeptidase [Ramaria rubella]|nr:serine carboxypeptidase [Ramaria rubella]